MDTLVLFTVPKEPDDEETTDLLAHARSAVAAVTIILSPMGKSIHYHRKPDPGGWIEDICRIEAENDKFLKIEKDSGDPAGIRAELTRYLGELRKELNAFIYRRDGETGYSLRELTVQTLINQVLLTRIRYTHRMQHDPVQEQTLFGCLFAYAGLSPAYDRYDIRIPDSSREEVLRTVHNLASIPSPSLSGIRLSWIEPETWAVVFRAYLELNQKRPTQRGRLSEYEDRIDPDSVLHTGIGGFIIRMLTDITNLDNTGPIYDPSPGCGEFIIPILRMHRMRKVLSGDTDSIISRLIMASDLIHASDASPVHICIIRFLIVISIIDGGFTDPQLYGPPLRYPLRALSEQVRTGNILYSPDLSDEFYSETAGYPALRHLHPLDPADLLPSGGAWSLVLSYPAWSTIGEYSETGSYLTRRYRSYQAGIHPAALLFERVQDHLAQDGTCIMVLPSSWLSEDQFRGFRKWVSLHLPAMIIMQEEDPEFSGITSISVLVMQKKGEPGLKIIKLQAAPEENVFEPRIFSVSRDQLPDTDGWNLVDPWEEEFLQRFGPEMMPLSGYLFDELYQGGGGREPSGHAEGWMSVILTRNDLVVHQGERPDPVASAIIPGRDLYLTGLLSSSLIRVYLQTIAGRTDSDGTDLNRIRNIPIRTVDEYCSNERLMRDTIIQNVQRIAMLRHLTGESRPWHDRERINRQIADSQLRLDLAVCSLYGLSTDDCHEIRRRVLPGSGFR